MSEIKHIAEVLNTTPEKIEKEIAYIMDSPAKESILEKIVSYASVLKGNRWTPKQYFKAVEYVTYRMADMSMVESYKATFPERLINIKGNDKPAGTVRSLASFYDRGDLPQRIMSQVQIPLHVIMMGERVNAASVLAHLMVHGETERIQMESADKLLNHIKPPETLKVEMDIGFQADDTLVELNEKLDALAGLAQSKILAKDLTPLQVIEYGK